MDSRDGEPNVSRDDDSGADSSDDMAQLHGEGGDRGLQGDTLVAVPGGTGGNERKGRSRDSGVGDNGGSNRRGRGGRKGVSTTDGGRKGEARQCCPKYFEIVVDMC